MCYNFMPQSLIEFHQKMSGKTLYDKLWDSHVVREEDGGTSLIYIDRHLIHEVTSPQAFAGLKESGRLPRRGGANLAVADHMCRRLIDPRGSVMRCHSFRLRPLIRTAKSLALLNTT